MSDSLITSELPIKVTACRACTHDEQNPYFELVVDENSGRTAKILTSVPHDIDNCRSITRFPMHSKRKLQELLTLADAGNNLWLDAISINQFDDEDKQRQIGAMGTIYENAECVAALLPEEDSEAGGLFTCISMVGMLIGHKFDKFVENEDAFCLNREPLSSVCQRFHALMGEIEEGLPRWKYFERAWTFQEWSLAQDITLTWEGGEGKIENLKSTTYATGELLVKYKLRNAEYGMIQQGFSRSNAIPYFERVKRIFPYSDFMLTDDEVDQFEEQKAALATSFANPDTLLRLRSEPRKPDDPGYFCERLKIMLSAFGMSKRKARFEADLVACWASMCNIVYDYKAEEPLAVALRKVISAIRAKGVKVYNFQSNIIGWHFDIDVQFLEYASSHRQCNSPSSAKVRGSPAFTGIADPVLHLQASVAPRGNAAFLGPPHSSTTLQPVLGAKIAMTSCLEENLDLGTFRSTIEGCVEGGADNMRWTDVIEELHKAIVRMTKEERLNHSLVIVTIPVSVGLDKRICTLLNMWAVCRSEYANKPLFVAREPLNGTIVLASPGFAIDPKIDAASVIAYLVITCHQTGSHLLETDDTGEIEMNISPKPVPGVGMRSYGGIDPFTDPKVLKAHLELGSETRVACGLPDFI